MNPIPAIEWRENQVRIRGIANDLVEVDHTVEGSFGANPLVDVAPDPRFVGIPPCVVSGRGYVVAGGDRGAVNAHAFGLDLPRNRRQSRDDLVRRRSPTDV